MSEERVTTVLHVITALNYGGAEAMLAKLVLAARRRQNHRHLVLSMLPPGVVGRQLRDQGLPVYTLGMRQGRPSLRGLLRLLALTRKLRPDVIQGWMYHGNLAAWAARQFARRQALLGWNVRHSLHDLRNEKRKSSLVIRLGAVLSRQADFIIFNSRVAIAEHRAAGFDTRAAILVPNGFDTGLFHPDGPGRPARAALAASLGIGPERTMIGMVARVHPMKDHANLFAAVRAVRDAGHDVHLVLAGADTDRMPAPLEQKLQALLPQDRVSRLGDRRDLAEWLPGLDIAVLSSAWGEGFPNVIGEALAAGVPCVATDVGDSREILGEGGQGVAPGDPAALAAALIRLIEAGPQARAAIGVTGRDRVIEHYSLDRIEGQYEQIYRDKLDGRQAALAERGSRDKASCAA